jgi:hypothetical protein
MSMNTNDNIGNPIRDIPVCISVLEPTAPPRTPPFAVCQDYNIETSRLITRELFLRPNRLIITLELTILCKWYFNLLGRSGKRVIIFISKLEI